MNVVIPSLYANTNKNTEDVSSRFSDAHPCGQAHLSFHSNGGNYQWYWTFSTSNLDMQGLDLNLLCMDAAFPFNPAGCFSFFGPFTPNNNTSYFFQTRWIYDGVAYPWSDEFWYPNNLNSAADFNNGLLCD